MSLVSKLFRRKNHPSNKKSKIDSDIVAPNNFVIVETLLDDDSSFSQYDIKSNILSAATVETKFFELPRDRQNSSKNQRFKKSKYSDKRVGLTKKH